MKTIKKLIGGMLALAIIMPSVSSAATVEEMQQQINALMAQIQTLYGQLQTSTPGATTGVVGDASDDGLECLNLGRELKYRSRDALTNGDVSAFQDFLNVKKYLASEPTGFFGLQTVSAIKKFQTEYKLRVTGIADAATRAKVKSLTCSSDASVTEPKTPNTPVVNDFNPFISVTPTELIQGKEYDFLYEVSLGGKVGYPTVRNLPIYGYIQRPDGSIKMSGQNIGKIDENGLIRMADENVFNKGVDITNGQVGFYRAWVIIGNKKSNVVEFKVKGTDALYAVPNIEMTSSKAAGNFEMDAGGEAMIYGSLLTPRNGDYTTTKVFIGGIQARITYFAQNTLGIAVPSSLIAGRNYDLYVSNTDGKSNVVSVKILNNLSAYPVVSTDSDKSVDYIKNPLTYPITREKYPDMFIAGIGKGMYVGNSGNYSRQIFGQEPNALQPKATDTAYDIYYDHCSGEDQLNEAFVQADGRLGAFGIPLQGQAFKCMKGVLVSRDQATTQKLTITAPNGGEAWQVGSTHMILWAPYDPVMGLNKAPEVSAYLEKKDDAGNFVKVGKIIESGKASIHWTGELDTFGNYAAPGTYYVRIENSATGQWDRSDEPFKLVGKDAVQADLKVNGSDGPITVPTGGADYPVRWTSNGDTCTIYNYSSNAAQLDSLAPNGDKTIKIFPSPYDGVPAISLSCTSKYPEGGASDVLYALTNPVNSFITVDSLNGGQSIDLYKPATISWKNSLDVTKVTLALYKNDASYKYIATDLPTAGQNGGSISWTPSSILSVPDTDTAKNAYKIYMIGYKNGGGTVEDKSDAGFSITAPQVSSPSFSLVNMPTVTIGGSMKVSFKAYNSKAVNLSLIGATNVNNRWNFLSGYAVSGIDMSYTRTVSSKDVDPGNYIIRVTDTANPNFYKDSNVFAIVSPTASGTDQSSQQTAQVLDSMRVLLEKMKALLDR